jgi:hypothetical protein
MVYNAIIILFVHQLASSIICQISIVFLPDFGNIMMSVSDSRICNPMHHFEFNFNAGTFTRIHIPRAKMAHNSWMQQCEITCTS